MGDTETKETPQYDGRMVYVSAKDDGKSVARKVTGAAMENAVHGFPVYLFSVRASTVNISTKACAIARAILGNDDTEIVCEPSFRDNRNEVTTKVMKADTVTARVRPVTDTVDMTVGSKSKITEVAGAIAGQIRADNGVTLTAVGPNAVFNAVRSVGVAREYLKQRNDPIELVYQPELVEVQLDGRDEPTNAMKLIVLPISDEATDQGDETIFAAGTE